MTARPITSKERKQLQEELDWLFDRGVHRVESLRDIGHRYNEIAHTMFKIKRLGLHSYKGCTYRELKQLREYIGRTLFHRRLTATLQDFQFSGAPGVDATGGRLDDLPTRPVQLKLKFQLEGLDGRKVLICTLDTWTNWSGTNRLTQDQLVVSLGRYGGRLLSAPTSEVAMHYRTNKQNPRELRCWDCNSSACTRERRFAVEGAVEAYERNGVTGVWHALDKKWVDIAAARPMTKPLTQQSLSIRCMLHGGQAVKIITPAESYLGKIEEIKRSESGEIRAISLGQEVRRVLGKSRTGWDIPASEILEILPCRPELEVPSGLAMS